jgi:hypothetical protein
VIWELNRHQHLVLLAQAFRLTGRSAYLDRIGGDLESWFAGNPYGRGVNWTSALEVAFRAFSWIWVYHLAGGSFSPELRSRFWTALYRHGCFLERNLSVFFSPNTHLLGEAVVLYTLGILFPQFPGAEKWKQSGGEWVDRQLERQVHADGSHFEQSSYYHVYALDMFLWYYMLAGKPAGATDKLVRMAEYLHALMGPQKTLPFLGDDDGGRFFHPYGSREGFGRATLATGAVLWSRPEWIRHRDDFQEQGIWWLGDRAVPGRDGATLEPVRSAFFPNAGVAVMCEGPVHIVADAGVFGHGSAGHSHSDTLSCVARRGREEVLLDAGTFTYLADPRWRKWFRGSAAHNTIRIDGRDQARSGGPFSWGGRPLVEKVSWTSGGEADFLDATCRYDGFTHRRRLLFLKPDLLVILDEVEGPPGEHLVEQFWHPGASEAVRRIALSDRASHEEGGENGWRSRAYGSKEPAPVLRVALRTGLPRALATAVDLSPAHGITAVDVSRGGGYLVEVRGARPVAIDFAPETGALPKLQWREITERDRTNAESH